METLTVTNTYFAASSQNGYFSIFNFKNKRINSIIMCREVLGWTWKKNQPCLLFATNRDFNIQQFEKQWHDMEKKIGIVTPSVIYKVSNDKRAVIIRFNDFWLEDATHKSACSLLLRMMVAYQGVDMDTMIPKYHLSNDCKYALNRFLNGYTKFTGKKLRYGFVYYLGNPPKETIDQLLIKP